MEACLVAGSISRYMRDMSGSRDYIVYIVYVYLIRVYNVACPIPNNGLSQPGKARAYGL